MDFNKASADVDAEMKIINAKKERSDKLSRLMGEYLLKGHKMLNETCLVCSCVLMQSREGVKYCVSCDEIDAENKKDDPGNSRTVLNAQAAAKCRHEEGHRSAALNQSDKGDTKGTDILHLENILRTKLTWIATEIDQSDDVQYIDKCASAMKNVLLCIDHLRRL